jgi:hypothetical protein
MADSISITTPPPNTTVGRNFQASGPVSPPSSPVTVTLNGTAAHSVGVMGSTWKAIFQNSPLGTGTLEACIDGTRICASESITVQ